MSHFTVLVMGEDLDSNERLSAALQPFHEYECTGCVDQFVVHVDKTEEFREDYLNSKERRVKLPDGELINPYSKDVDRFGRPATAGERALIQQRKFDGVYRSTGFGDDAEITVIEYPAGTEDVQIPTSTVETIEEWLEGYHGIDTIFDEFPEEKPETSYAVVNDGELIYAAQFTNEDAKWDWWTLGGRWNGAFDVKPGMEKLAHRGRPGVFGEEAEGYDLVRKDALDFAKMKADAVTARRNSWARTYEKMLETAPDMTQSEADAIRYEILQKHEELTQEWRDDPAEDKLHFFEWVKNKIDARLAPHFGAILDYFESSVRDTGEYEHIADWIDDAPAIGSYAMIIDGKWIGRGEMGWFGMSSGDESEKAWRKRVNDAIEALPDDHWLAMVDCHI